jgi:hypothetical protein
VSIHLLQRCSTGAQRLAAAKRHGRRHRTRASPPQQSSRSPLHVRTFLGADTGGRHMRGRMAETPDRPLRGVPPVLSSALLGSV